jgi:tetratricopeptide (TPR) repeat protein
MTVVISERSMTHARSLRRVLAITACGLALPLITGAARAPDLAGLLNRYERGEFEAVARAMTELPPSASQFASIISGDPGDPLVKEVQRLAPNWISAAGAEATTRRRLVIASFALELAYWHRTAPGVRYPLLLWGCDLLRKNPTRLPGERWWHLSAIALHEEADDWIHVLGEIAAKPPPPMTRASFKFFSRADQEEFSKGHLEHARAAIPDEPRLLLPAAHYAESLTFLSGILGGPNGINSQQTSPEFLESMERIFQLGTNAVPGSRELDQKSVKEMLARVDQIPKVAERYAALGANPALRADAELRQGFLDLRLTSWETALAHLDEVPRTTDEPALIGLSHHFRGWIFEQTRRTEEAVEAYRLALAAAPRARSVSILLAAQLTKAGQLHEAYAVLDDALKASPTPALRFAVALRGRGSSGRFEGNVNPPPDLWLLYRRGDAVMLRTYVDRLREALR